MELSPKEKIIVFAALNQYMDQLKAQLASGELDEDEHADTVNDAVLLDILIARFREELS
jgi:hypothetical protein